MGLDSGEEPGTMAEKSGKVKVSHALALKDAALGYQFSMPAIITGAGLASYTITCFLLVWTGVGDDSIMSKARQQVDKSAYLVVASAFMAALAMNILTLMFESSDSRRQLALLACYINFVAGSSHVLGLFELSPMRAAVLGGSVNLHRQAMWLFTTPVMIYMISTISSFSKAKVYQVMAADFGMIVAGILTQMLPSPSLALISAAACTGVFVWVQWQMWQMFDAPLALAEDPRTKSTLKALRFWTVTVWCYFPLVWSIVACGHISIEEEEWLWAAGDFLAKIFYSSSLLHGNFLTIEQRRAATLAIVEAANRSKTINDLEQMVLQKDRFLSSMSHELRTPLNGIIGLSDALLVNSCGVLNEQCTKTISTIKNSGLRLLNLINDILDSASMRKGQLVVKQEKVHLKPVVDDVVELCEPLARRGTVLRNTIPSALPPIAGDTGRMIQIFYNLVGNSCKFTHGGQIVVSAKEDADAVEVSVSDTGIGIPKDKFDAIFEEFEQVDMSTTRKYGGTGLGLNLVKQLVDAHEGTISVSSELGKGTTFTLRLKVWDPTKASSEHVSMEHAHMRAAPAPQKSVKRGSRSQMTEVPAYSPPAPAAAATPASPAQEELKKKESRPSSKELGVVRLPAVGRQQQVPSQPAAAANDANASTRRQPYSMVNDGKLQVLSVDDDPTNQLVIQNLLEPIGYQVEQAMDGEAALKFLEQSPTMPDIILLDVRMPGMSGYEVCRKLRSLYHDYFLPVIMVSAQTSEEEIVQGLLSGANDYVTKPFGRQALLARINSHLKVKAFVSHQTTTGTGSSSRSMLDQFRTAYEKQKAGEKPAAVAAVEDKKKPDDKEGDKAKKKGKSRLLAPAAILATTTRRTLPRAFAEKIAAKESPQGPHVEEFPSVTVLVAQLDNIAELSETVEPAEFISALAEFSLHVEFLLENNSLYMFEDSEQRLVMAGGMTGEADHTSTALEFAKSLLRAAATVKLPDEQRLELTIGIHTGPAMGVVSGLHKPILSLTGPAAHQAGVLQYTCPTNCIHISTAVSALIPGSQEELLQVTEHSFLLRDGAHDIPQTDKIGQSLKKALAQPWVRIPTAPTPLQQALIALSMAKPSTLWDAVTQQNAGEGEVRRVQHAKLALEKQLDEVTAEADRLQDTVDALQEELALTKKSLAEAAPGVAAPKAEAGPPPLPAAPPSDPGRISLPGISDRLLSVPALNTPARGSLSSFYHIDSGSDMRLASGSDASSSEFLVGNNKIAKLEAELEAVRNEKASLQHSISRTLQQMMVSDRPSTAPTTGVSAISDTSVEGGESSSSSFIDATINVLTDPGIRPLMVTTPLSRTLSPVSRSHTMREPGSPPSIMAGLLGMVGLGHLTERFLAEGITPELLPIMATDDEAMKRCGVTNTGDRLRLKMANWAQARMSATAGGAARVASMTAVPLVHSPSSTL